MPFIEVTDSGPDLKKRGLAASGMTHGLCEAFGIKPEIVTVYYNSAPDYSYAHAGKFGEDAEKFRIFVKVHAFPRDAAMKAQAARTLTDAVVDAYAAAPKDVIIYFFDTVPSDAFHAGIAQG